MIYYYLKWKFHKIIQNGIVQYVTGTTDMIMSLNKTLVSKNDQWMT